MDLDFIFYILNFIFSFFFYSFLLLWLIVSSWNSIEWNYKVYEILIHAQQNAWFNKLFTVIEYWMFWTISLLNIYSFFFWLKYQFSISVSSASEEVVQYSSIMFDMADCVLCRCSRFVVCNSLPIAKKKTNRFHCWYYLKRLCYIILFSFFLSLSHHFFPSLALNIMCVSFIVRQRHYCYNWKVKKESEHKITK